MRWTKNAAQIGCHVAASLLLLIATGVYAQQGGQPVRAVSPTPPSEIAPPPSPEDHAYAVVLDAAHGGNNLGARLQAGTDGSDLDEKTFTLNLANRLSAQLRARFISVTLTRTADVDISGDARAESMNHAHAAACLSLHATTAGNGVHLFTSSLPPSAAPAELRDFVPWQTAQSNFITQSLRLESEVKTALAREQIPVLLGRATLMPLESATCPAIAVEIAPLNASTPATDPKYQQQIVDALVAALTHWSTDWRMQP